MSGPRNSFGEGRVMEHPYCDHCVVYHATVQCEDVGLCDDCAEAAIRDLLVPLLGRRCASLRIAANGYLSVCLAPAGQEHEHD